MPEAKIYQGEIDQILRKIAPPSNLIHLSDSLKPLATLDTHDEGWDVRRIARESELPHDVAQWVSSRDVGVQFRKHMQYENPLLAWEKPWLKREKQLRLKLEAGGIDGYIARVKKSRIAPRTFERSTTIHPRILAFEIYMECGSLSLIHELAQLLA